MISTRTVAATLASLFAFAANSLLARAALLDSAIGETEFTAIRLASGAIVLAAVVRFRRRGNSGSPDAGTWLSGAALFLYAIAFSWAYRSLEAGTGALLLFGAVQITMISWSLVRGERLGAARWLGFGLASAGLVSLLAPGLTAPDPLGALLMVLSGTAWGVYSIRGGGADPTAATAGNFLRSLPWAAGALVVAWLVVGSSGGNVAGLLAATSRSGVLLALASGAVTSGLGYVLWYAALRQLTTATAGIVQLAVPVIATAGGVLLLGETLTPRLVGSGTAVLVGVALALLAPATHPIDIR